MKAGKRQPGFETIPDELGTSLKDGRNFIEGHDWFRGSARLVPAVTFLSFQRASGKAGFTKVRIGQESAEAAEIPRSVLSFSAFPMGCT